MIPMRTLRAMLLVGIASAVVTATAAAQPIRLAGSTCETPPVLHCPDQNCPGDVVTNGGPVVEPKTNRNYFLDYPCDLTRGEKVTFILSLHGGGSYANWQRHYFPILDYKDKHRLVIATPFSPRRVWGAEDDEYLQNIVTSVVEQLGKENIKAFWLAGHSQGGLTARRIVCSEFFASRVDGFLSLSAVGEYLTELHGAEAPRVALLEYGTLAFHAVHSLRAGTPLFLLTTRAARGLVEAAPTAASAAEGAAPAPPTPAGYLQLPQHLFWARLEGAAPESVDGAFWTVSATGRLHVLPVTGLRPDRAGFGTLAVPDAPLAHAAEWVHAMVREGGTTQVSNAVKPRLTSVTVAAETLTMTRPGTALATLRVRRSRATEHRIESTASSA